MLLSDTRFLELGDCLIQPFRSRKLSKKILSYGVCECGYDLTLSPDDFRIMTLSNHDIIDPKNANSSDYESLELFYGDFNNTLNCVESWFVIPPQTYALGFVKEHVNIPDNLTGLVIGKSTYARVSLMLNTTPIDPGFVGHITLEFYNPARRPIKVYANEGICKLILWDTDTVKNPYNGKYQNQKSEVTLSKLIRG